MLIRYMLLHAYGSGGTIRTVMNQANSLVEAGHDIEIVSVLRHREHVRFPLDPRVRVTTLVDDTQDTPGAGAPAPPGWRAGYRSRRNAALRNAKAQIVPEGEFGSRYFTRFIEQEIIRYLRRVEGGVLVTTRPALNVLSARYAPKRVVRVAQEHMNLSVHRPDVQKAIKAYYPRFDAVAVLTERDRQDYAELLPGTRLVRIPNAVHSMDQEPSDHSGKTVVAAGRLLPQKGFDMLIPAWQKVAERHPDWQLRIFGYGEKKEQLRALIEQFHLYNHVFLMGHTDHLDDELAKSSLYVLSSRFEGLPMVMIEAMAHALPVVSFDCPTGPADVLTDGKEGILVPPEDVEGLADALCRLMASRELRAEMGAAALRKAQDFSPAAVHPQWEALFTELTAARSAREEARR